MISGGASGGEASVPDSKKANIGLISSVATPVIIEKLPNLSASVSFYGLVKCKLSEVKMTIAFFVAVAATALAFKSIIRMLAIPELAHLAVSALRAMVVAALSLAGVANAEEVSGRDCMVGNCTFEEHAALEEEKDKWCSKPSSCSQGMSHQTLAEYANNALLCAESRQTIMNQCFDGGDEGHKTALENALASYENCISILAGM